MSALTFCRSLVEANTGLTTPYNTIEALKEAVKDEKKEFYCFWGYYKSSSVTPEVWETFTDQIKEWFMLIGDMYYLKEIDFNIVTGYELIPFEDATDWSVYHPPAGTGFPSLDGVTLDLGPGMTLNVVGRDGKTTESRWVPEQSVIKFVTGGSSGGIHDCYFLTISKKQRIIDQTTLKARDAKEDEISNENVKKYYAISYTEIDEGMTVPWTYKKRLGAFSAEYVDNKIPETSIKTLAPNIFGKIPGMDY